MIFRVSNFRVSKQQILLELNDLIDIAKPMKENGSGQTMSSKKAKSHGMKLTVMEDEMSILGLSDSRKETSVGLDQFRQIRCVRAPSLKAVNYRAPQQRLFLDCVNSVLSRAQCRLLADPWVAFQFFFGLKNGPSLAPKTDPKCHLKRIHATTSYFGPFGPFFRLTTVVPFLFDRTKNGPKIDPKNGPKTGPSTFSFSF